MRFITTLQNEPKHSELVSCVGWTTPDEVYSGADDHNVNKWSLLSNESSIMIKLPEDIFPTDMHWTPKVQGKKGFETVALCSTDGK